MAAINIFSIDWDPAPKRLDCSGELHPDLEEPRFDLSITPHDLKTSFVALYYFEELFENSRQEYWKIRTMAQMVLSPYILSLSFIPRSVKVASTLFLQRVNKAEVLAFEQQKDLHFIQGFFAPQLGQFKAIPVYSIKDANMIDETIQDLPSETIQDTQTLLKYFLEDSLTQGITVTFSTISGNLSRAWLKV